MDTRKLSTFVDLAKTESYVKTAEHLKTTQATISKRIMALEKEWKLQLFSRAHKRVMLTPAGKVILPEVERLLREEKVVIKVVEIQRSRQKISVNER